MDSHLTPNKTPSKFLEAIPKEIREAVQKRNQLQGSPFCILPHHTTPPSQFIKIRNPFEAALNDQLHLHIFSPSVFSETRKPRNSDKFKWTIDDVSALQPALIDESTIAQFEQTSAEEDVHVQAKIEKYFSETHIVPSPWNPEVNHLPLLPESPENKLPAMETIPEAESKEMCNVWTQTVLSLPPTLPKELENALKPYFSFTEDQRRQSVDLNSSLCRRLFEFDSSSVISEEDGSVHEQLSAVGSPVFATSADQKRNFGSSPDAESLIPGDISPILDKFDDFPFSPITANPEHLRFRAQADHVEQNTQTAEISPVSLTRRSMGQSFARLDYSGHMSVDTSFNMAPENDHNDTDLTESPVRTNEFMENSCNWDLEYNNISLNSRQIRRNLFEEKTHSTATEYMDISNLATPKSKSFNLSQRKKLSGSLNFDDSLSEEDGEPEEGRQSKRLNFCDKYAVGDSDSTDFVLSQNTQDTGYNTETSHRLNYSKDEDMVISYVSENSDTNKENRNPNIFASTPSKRYFSLLE